MCFPIIKILRNQIIFWILLVLLVSLVSGLPARAEEYHKYPAAVPSAVLGHFAAEKPWDTLFGPPHLESYARVAMSVDDTREYAMGYNWEGPPPENPDWQSLQRDTTYFVVYQFVALAVMYVSPDSFSKWNKHDQKDFSLKKWKKNVSNPVWDEDDLYINYILHPYWGATYYILGRERGLNRPYSFWFSFLLSSLFEYGAEALFEPVSIQDMIVTPLAGALLGEYVFSPIRQWARADGELNWADKTLLIITDPLGMINAGLNTLLGVDTQVRFCELKMESMVPPAGLWLNQAVQTPTRTAWGVQMIIRW